MKYNLKRFKQPIEINFNVGKRSTYKIYHISRDEKAFKEIKALKKSIENTKFDCGCKPFWNSL